MFNYYDHQRASAMSQKKVDYIIVGQGLAGSCLALQLKERGKQFIVFDQPQLNRSTAVAAGLFNPITGRVMTKTWKADLLFSYLLLFYHKAEELLNNKFFHCQNLYRPFLSIEEQNEWMAKSEDAELKKYIEQVFLHSAYGSQVNDPLGGLLLKQCGHLDTISFTDAVRRLLLECGSYREENFDHALLEMKEGTVEYQDIIAQKIIFCGGLADTLKDYFKALPLRPLKGETLQIKIDQPLDKIYNRGVYIVPTQVMHEYKVGATYSTQDKNEQITAAARKELEVKLSDLIRLPYEVTHQNWGMRPSSSDRRPILGPHPKENKLIIFNGLGTKGVSLAPYFSGQLADWLDGKGEIDREVNIARFYSKM